MNIKKQTSCLIGQSLKDAGRAGDMLWLAFGDEVQVTDIRGKTRIVHKYALHVQCPWRFTDSQHIIMASYDFYIPRKGVTEAVFNKLEDTFKYSRFDEMMDAFKNQFVASGITVNGIDLDNYGGLRLHLSKGIDFDIFLHSSLKKEFWRFFENGSKKNHFVVFE